MQKLAQKLKILALLGLSVALVGCKDEPQNLTKPLPTKSGFSFYDTPLNYINYIRTMSNLSSFAPNEILDKAAFAHAKYVVVNNEISHDETPGRAEFSGKTPSERAFAAGFNSSVRENLSYNAHDIKASIDGLLSAIYHRFAFLDYDSDLIGVGFYENADQSAYVYEMGNSGLEKMCDSDKSQSGNGKFLIGLCKNKSLAIKSENYERSKMLSAAQYVIYPSAEPAIAYFSHEIPDPMPECTIMANPVSVEFNPNAKSVEMIEFRLFDADGAELKNTKILDKKSDPNRRLNERQFVLFSKDILKFGASYSAVFRYRQNGKEEQIKWSFTTQTPQYDYFEVHGGEALEVKNGKIYDIFFVPKDCNDEVKSYKTSYNGAMEKPHVNNIATNMFRVRVQGERGAQLEISADGGKKVTLVITDEPKNSSIMRKIINLF